MNYIFDWALKKLNPIKRFSADLINPSIFWILYYSFIYPILSYGSVVWCPYLQYQQYKLENINHLFFSYVAFKVNRRMKFYDKDFPDISTFMEILNETAARNRTDSDNYQFFIISTYLHNIFSRILENK